jgi:predicted nucleic acid-binding protein
VIVADTAALISLASVDTISLVLEEYDVHTTETVVQELQATSEYDDAHAAAATRVLDQLDELTVRTMPADFESSRVDRGEASVAKLAAQTDADFLLTDDLRALPELESITDAQVAISPFVLKALVTRGVLSAEEARERLDMLADTRGWLGAPIYRRARQLFGD